MLTILHTDLAYIAGLLDGEGCITICRNRENYQLRLSISMVDAQAIDFLAEITKSSSDELPSLFFKIMKAFFF